MNEAHASLSPPPPQVFGLEASLGPVKGCVFLDAAMPVRIARMAAKTPGELAAVTASVQASDRELAPVVAWFRKLGKAVTVETSKMTTDEVFEAARPFLE